MRVKTTNQFIVKQLKREQQHPKQHKNREPKAKFDLPQKKRIELNRAEGSENPRKIKMNVTL